MSPYAPTHVPAVLRCNTSWYIEYYYTNSEGRLVRVRHNLNRILKRFRRVADRRAYAQQEVARLNIKLAMERHGCAGKTEMWYIIKSDVGAKIYAGLKKSITPEDYEQMVTTDSREGENPMANIIATHEAHQGDLFFLPAGRLHAIGAGCFLAEIQQDQRHHLPRI